MKKNRRPIPMFRGKVPILNNSSVEERLELIPKGGMVVLEPMMQEVTRGGIAVPEEYQAANMPRFRVKAVGPGRMTINGTRVPIDVKVGEIVLISQLYGKIVQFKTMSNVLVAEEEAIIAAIDPASLETPLLVTSSAPVPPPEPVQ